MCIANGINPRGMMNKQKVPHEIRKKKPINTIISKKNIQIECLIWIDVMQITMIACL